MWQRTDRYIIRRQKNYWRPEWEEIFGVPNKETAIRMTRNAHGTWADGMIRHQVVDTETGEVVFDIGELKTPPARHLTPSNKLF